MYRRYVRRMKKTHNNSKEIQIKEDACSQCRYHFDRLTFLGRGSGIWPFFHSEVFVGDIHSL